MGHADWSPELEEQLRQEAKEFARTDTVVLEAERLLGSPRVFWRPQVIGWVRGEERGHTAQAVQDTVEAQADALEQARLKPWTQCPHGARLLFIYDVREDRFLLRFPI